MKGFHPLAGSTVGRGDSIRKRSLLVSTYGSVQIIVETIRTAGAVANIICIFISFLAFHIHTVIRMFCTVRAYLM